MLENIYNIYGDIAMSDTKQRTRANGEKHASRRVAGNPGQSDFGAGRH